jgi:hypothetical protein
MVMSISLATAVPVASMINATANSIVLDFHLRMATSFFLHSWVET